MKISPTKIIIISFLIFCSFNFYLSLKYPEIIVDTSLVKHVEKINPIIYNKKAIATAYTLSINETDLSPCVGAGNHNLCELRRENPSKCIIATRRYSLHAKLLIEGFGECEVLDRTAKKYGNRIDILFTTREEAIKFGKKEIRYKVIK